MQGKFYQKGYETWRPTGLFVGEVSQTTGWGRTQGRKRKHPGRTAFTVTGEQLDRRAQNVETFSKGGRDHANAVFIWGELEQRGGAGLVSVVLRVAGSLRTGYDGGYYRKPSGHVIS